MRWLRLSGLLPGAAAHAALGEKAGLALILAFIGLVLLFLIAPLLIIVPLSFNAEPFFSFPMPGLSWRWYEDLVQSGRWLPAAGNSLTIAAAVTAMATGLGTAAALGLNHPAFPFRRAAMALLISPMIVPVVVVAVGAYFFYAPLGLVNTKLGLILAHTALATPFVVITVAATLSGYDENLSRAAASLGAPPAVVFFRITLPVIRPGVISGALLAFVASFDEVVVALFLLKAEDRTLPMQMFTGIREQVSPTITAAATLLFLLAIGLFALPRLIKRRGPAGQGQRP